MTEFTSFEEALREAAENSLTTGKKQTVLAIGDVQNPKAYTVAQGRTRAAQLVGEGLKARVAIPLVVVADARPAEAAEDEQ